MIFYKFRRKIRNYFRSTFDYYSTLIKCFFVKTKDKKVFFEVNKIEKNRYLYNLVKFFKLRGYTVYLPKNKELIARLCVNKGEFKYASLILDADVKIGIPKRNSQTVFLTTEKLSNDYFSKNKLKNTFHVPMSQYPLIYNEDNGNDSIDLLAKRKLSAFISGNFNVEFYGRIAKDGFFDILSRSDIFDFIKQQSYFFQINSFSNLLGYIDSTIDNKVVIIDRVNDFNIDLDKIKSILLQFDFFMALPGIDIPQSHNLIEAMEVGCIPIIQKTYSDLLYPPLVHNVNAIIYETKEELDSLIREVFKKNEEDIILLRQNVLKYYDNYLTPKAVVDAIVNTNYDKIYIQAEHVSLNLLRKK
jgi:hypothetical protein